MSIMGPSGDGKPTMLHILGMWEDPTYGDYRFMAEDVVKMNERKRMELYRHHIGFVFQAYHLIDEMTVAENIEAPLLYKKVPSAERKSRIGDILDRFNIVAKRDLFPNQLSGGQQQLVGIARAIVAQPSIILADEPTGNLQSAQALQIMDLFRKLNQEEGMTIIQVTHSEVNATYGTRVLQLLDGVVKEDSKQLNALK